MLIRAHAVILGASVVVIDASFYGSHRSSNGTFDYLQSPLNESNH